MEKTLKKDHFSHCKNRILYGKKGDHVKIVNNKFGKVAIVSNSRGQRFPVLKDDLG